MSIKSDKKGTRINHIFSKKNPSNNKKSSNFNHKFPGSAFVCVITNYYQRLLPKQYINEYNIEKSLGSQILNANHNIPEVPS
jgi:hypothetical protein